MSRLLIILAALTAFPGFASAGPGDAPPHKLQVELGIHAGTVADSGLRDFTATGVGQLTLRLSWAVAGRVRLGLRIGLLGSYLPLGEKEADVAFLTTTFAFLFECRLWRWLSFDLSAGFAAPFGLDGDGTYSQPVSPTFGAGLLATVLRQRRVELAVRLGFDAVIVANDEWAPSLFHAVVGLLIRFPLQRPGPGLDRKDVPDPFEERFRDRTW